MPEKMLLTVPEAAMRLGLGRSFVYQLVMTGELPSVKLGRARRVSVRAIDEYVERLQGEQVPAAPPVAKCKTPEPKPERQ